MIIGTDDSILDPCWDEGGKIHNWRNYIGERTRAVWQSLTPEQRRAIAEDAQDLADTENWE